MAQIGTVKLQTQNSGVVDVPVFETGDSGSNTYEFVRVQTASGTGFIPVINTNDAAYPYIRVQSQNNGVVAVTDRASAIPDSNLYRVMDGTRVHGIHPANRPIWTQNGYTYAVQMRSDTGEIEICQFDNSTTDSTTNIIGTAGDTEVYHLPAVAVDNGGTIYVVYDGRYGDNLNYAISDSPDDISSFTTDEISGDDSYKTLIEYDGTLYIFTREGQSTARPLVVHRSDDGGSTWSTRNTVIDAGEEYYIVDYIIDSDNDELHLLVEIQESGHDDRYAGLYVRYDTVNDDVIGADGTNFGGSVTSRTDLENSDSIIAEADSGELFVTSLELLSDNTPITSYIDWNTSSGDVLSFAKYDSGSWSESTIDTDNFDNIPESNALNWRLDTLSDNRFVQWARTTNDNYARYLSTDAGDSWTKDFEFDPADENISSERIHGVFKNRTDDQFEWIVNTPEYTYIADYFINIDELTIYDQLPEDSGGDSGGGSVVDDFEHDSLSSYYTGDTGGYDTQTSTVKEGTYALQTAWGSEFTAETIYSGPGDGLDNYPSRGDTVEWWTRFETQNPRVYLFAETDEDDVYFFDILEDGNEIRIGKRVGGSGATLNTTSVSVSADTWYRAEVDSTSTDITFTLYDESDTELGSTSASDSDVDGQRIGFTGLREESNNEAWWDDMKVIE